MHYDYVIETSNLKKSFCGIDVIKDVSMHVKEGEIYGFVGPNGAGKSTVLKMLLNLIQPDNGIISMWGERITDKNYMVRKQIGSIIENPYFYDKLTARKNLESHCHYMGFSDLSKINKVLEAVSLDKEEQKPVAKYSLGMKQRLAIARAILTKPRLLLLDEPINALDPSGIVEMRMLFKKLSSEYGITILISSHILSEVELIVNTVGIIQKGKLIEEITMDKIKEWQNADIEIVVQDVEKAKAALNGRARYTLMDSNRMRISNTIITEIEISELLVRSGAGLIGIYKNQKNLEDYFFNKLSEDKPKGL